MLSPTGVVALYNFKSVVELVSYSKYFPGLNNGVHTAQLYFNEETKITVLGLGAAETDAE